MSRKLKVLDLFSGLGGWSAAFKERGHDVITIDVESRFKPTIVADLFRWDPSTLGGWKPDIVLASPPCSAFTVMVIGRNWTPPPENAPKNDAARLGLNLLERTIELIDFFNPRWFIIENPRAKMRTMPQVANMERRTVTYCQYGENRMKPTDLWSTRWPSQLILKPPCTNGAPCHVRAPRGSKTGTQGMTAEVSALIPYALSLAVCEACEKEDGDHV